jgi:hypothetical protein
MKSICNILCQFFARGYVMCSTFNFPLISLGLLVETPTDLPWVTVAVIGIDWFQLQVSYDRNHNDPLNCVRSKNLDIKFSAHDMFFRLFWAYLMKVILSVPDEGYFEHTWWRLFWVSLMKVILSVPDEGYFEHTWWRFFW